MVVTDDDYLEENNYDESIKFVIVTSILLVYWYYN